MELSNEEAERIGAVIAREFKLKRNRRLRVSWGKEVYDTEEGTRTNQGVARRIVRIIEENLGRKL